MQAPITEGVLSGVAGIRAQSKMRLPREDAVLVSTEHFLCRASRSRRSKAGARLSNPDCVREPRGRVRSQCPGRPKKRVGSVEHACVAASGLEFPLALRLGRRGGNKPFRFGLILAKESQDLVDRESRRPIVGLVFRLAEGLRSPSRI